MRSKIQKEIILILCGDLLHFTPFLVAKCFYQLSQTKTNQSIIPSPISKPIRTFLHWVTTFYFARFAHTWCNSTLVVIFSLFTKISFCFANFVHTQCKHHFSGYLFFLHKDNKVFAMEKLLLKNISDIFAPFLHNLSAQAHFRLSPFSRTSSTSLTTNSSSE